MIRMPMLSLFVTVVLATTSLLSADVLYDQDWEDTNLYFPGRTGNDGAAEANTVGGRWLFFADPAPNISDSVFRNGTQSAFIQRAATSGGSSLSSLNSLRNSTNTDTLYDATVWVNRTNPTSSAGVILTDSGNTNASIAAFITNAGDIRYWDDNRAGGAGYVFTNTAVADDEWVRIRFDVDLTNDVYDLFVMPDGGSETQVTPTGGVALNSAVSEIRNIIFAPSAPQDTTSRIYIDDILITTSTIPEPGSLGLLGASLALFGRRWRRLG